MNPSLRGRTILITSGPTRAPIDAVRFIANRSTGRLGTRIALEALSRGVNVVFVRGPDSAVPDLVNPDWRGRFTQVDIETIDDLAAALERALTGSKVDAVVHAMAVLDYVPAVRTDEKVRSGMAEWTLRLVPTPKVIGRIRQWAPGVTLVGFKLESGRSEDELIMSARSLAAGSGARLVVANDAARIVGDRHPALLVEPDGRVVARPQTKPEIAAALCDWLSAH